MMKKTNCFPLLMAALLSLGVSACNKPADTSAQAEVEKTAAPIASGDTSQNALDWNGRYQGTLPCADCEGIETSLTLNLDGSYQLQQRYLGREQPAHQDVGNIRWDASGSKITLMDGSQFMVGENQLFMLDQNGQRIEGNLAAHYRLAKQQ
ncbi:copper resistance protein NlpE [Shewanella sp. YIC-542]|uniref:copper resistance protein NlpE n=1 Tax=Shewanella mytili TaxID=3377111 RepID=UPI00398E79EE